MGWVGNQFYNYDTPATFDETARSQYGAEQQRYGESLIEYEKRKKLMYSMLGQLGVLPSKETKKYGGVSAEQAYPELRETVGLYAKGGEYGAGLRGLAEEGERKGLASYQGAAVAAGMSSSAGALNQMTESSRRLGLRYAEIEDMRIDKYARALETLGTTKTTGYLTASQILGGLSQPTVSAVASPAGQQYISGKAGITQAGISAAGRSTGTTTAPAAPAATEESSRYSGSGYGYSSVSPAPKYPKDETVIGPGNIFAETTKAGGTGYSAYTNMMHNLGIM